MTYFLLRMKSYARQEIATLERWVKETPEGKTAELMRRDLNETKERFELIYGESYDRYLERIKKEKRND